MSRPLTTTTANGPTALGDGLDALQAIHNPLGNPADSLPSFGNPYRPGDTGATAILPAVASFFPPLKIDHLAHRSKPSLNSQAEDGSGAFQRGGKTFQRSVNGAIDGGTG